MRARPAIVAGLAGLTALGGLTSCGSHTTAGDLIHGRELTVYASLPLTGSSAPLGRSALGGARLALEEAGGRVGDLHITLRVLDDSTPQRREWDPGQTSINARLAAADPRTVSYLGDLDSGASAVSIPLLARPGIPQVSPASGAVGLTSDGPGSSPGEPEKYYPTGIRTFVRVPPDDSVQAHAQAILQKAAGCRRTTVVDDGQVDGEAMTNSFTLAAKAAGLTVPAVQVFDPTALDFSAVAAAVSGNPPDCVFFSADAGPATTRAIGAVAAAVPNARLFGADGLAVPTFADPRSDGLPVRLASRLTLTSPVLGATVLGAPGQRFLLAYARRYGTAEPSAMYGYEAMALLLRAIRKATDGGRRPARRSAVRAALFAIRDRNGVPGRYSVTSDGSTTLRRYGAFVIAGGQLVFWKALAP